MPKTLLSVTRSRVQQTKPLEASDGGRLDPSGAHGKQPLIRTWRPWERSTGPRTAEGKTCTAQDGLKMGWNIPCACVGEPLPLHGGFLSYSHAASVLILMTDCRCDKGDVGKLPAQSQETCYDPLNHHRRRDFLR